MSAVRGSGLRDARRLVIAACRPPHSAPDLAALARGVDADDLLAAAEYHGVASTLYDRLQHVDGVPTSALVGLLEIRLVAQAKRLDAQRSLWLLDGALDVPFLVVKGPVLSSYWYGDDQVREFGDLDVLVAPADFGRAVEALGAEGAVPRATNWHGFRKLGVAEIPLALGATTVDLHWDLVALGEHRCLIRLRTSELFDDSVEVRIGDHQVRTLGPVDTLLHLCVNMGLEGAYRLRGLVDIDTVLGSGRVDLDEFAVRAERSGARRLCAAVLQRTVTAVGTELPAGFVASLSPSRSWLLANSAIDGLGRRSNRHVSVASGWLVAAGRPTALATGAALGRAIRRRALEPLGKKSLGQVGGELDWQRVPTDGDVDAHRRRYLDFVAAQVQQLRQSRCRDADELHVRIGELQPRTTPMLGAAFLDGLRGRRCRADVFEFVDGTLGAVVVRYRWTIGRVTAYPLLLDEGVVRTVADFLQRSSVTDLAGMDRDTLPLRPFMSRWRGGSATTPASLPPGFVWADPPDNVRVATQADLDDLVDAFWRYSPHEYPNRALLRHRLRKSIDQLVLVAESGLPPVPAGFAILDSSTPEYDYWAQVVVVPDHRGEGLSWDLVAAGAAHASSRGVGGLVLVADSNPMPLPEDTTADEGWNFIGLSPPRRVRGEVRVRRLLDSLLALQSRKSDDDSLPVYRTPGRGDSLVSERRSQRWFREQRTGRQP